jgi:hypothetical protein
MTRSTVLYRAAARVLAATVFRSDSIASVCVRRSVAAGEASLPFSDIDLDITLCEDSGPRIYALWKRYRLAQALCPRTGQCFVLTPGELEELAATEPYRASINRRCHYDVRGVSEMWPGAPITRLEAGRRVVFWLEHFFPLAVRTRHRRNQRKFYLEMCNALGLLDGSWEEPRITLREVERVYPVPTGDLFAAGLERAGAAHRLLGRPAPAICRAIELPGLTILPSCDSRWPPATVAGHGIVATPAALDLLLQTQSPALWTQHERALVEAGFEPPSRWTWARSARRLAGAIWLRGPGFFEKADGRQEERLRLASQMLEGLVGGAGMPTRLPFRRSGDKGGVGRYYLHEYARLSAEAAELRARARAIEERLQGETDLSVEAHRKPSGFWPPLYLAARQSGERAPK